MYQGVFYEAGDERYGILITETPDIFAVSVGEELNAYHVIYIFVGTL